MENSQCEPLALANTPTGISEIPTIWLPHLPLDALATVKNNTSDFQEVIKDHFAAFDLDADTTVNCAGRWSKKEATKDVTIVRNAFPHIAQQHGTVAAAASWFRLLCSYDDLAESLDATSAVAMMDEITAALAHDDRESKPRRDSGTWTETSTSLPTQWTEIFLRRLRFWLPESVICNIKQDLTHYCAAIAQEARLRESGEVVRPSTYLDLRTQTIGLQPFFSIIAGVLCPSQKQCAPDLRRDFQEAVSIAVGLQNDLVGLRREIALDQTFNLVLLLKQQGHPLELSMSGVVDCHNEAVNCAIQTAAEITSQDPSHAQYATSIIAFVRTHYAWSSASSRYRTGFQDDQVSKACS